MNGPAPDEAGLRAEFEHLRRLDAARSTSFARCWSAATGRQQAAKDHRASRVWFAAAAMAGLVAVALVLPGIRSWQLPRPPSPVDGDSAHLLAQWTVPTDVLLATPGRDLWRTTPRLGVPLSGWIDSSNLEPQQ